MKLQTELTVSSLLTGGADPESGIMKMFHPGLLEHNLYLMEGGGGGGTS